MSDPTALRINAPAALHGLTAQEAISIVTALGSYALRLHTDALAAPPAPAAILHDEARRLQALADRIELDAGI